MKTVILKLDSKIAKIFQWPEFNKAPKILEEKHVEHHSHLKSDETHFVVNKFFHEVAKSLEEPEEILLLGNHANNAEFKHHLQNHHHEKIFKKIVGTETINSHVSDGEILKQAGIFFESYRTFTKNY